MNRVCGVSTVFWIFWMVGACLCHQENVHNPVNELGSWDCHCLLHDLRLFNKNIEHSFTVLLLWNLSGLLNPLHHWDLRQDRNFDDFVAEPPSTVWTIGACPCTTTCTFLLFGRPPRLTAPTFLSAIGRGDLFRCRRKCARTLRDKRAGHDT